MRFVFVVGSPRSGTTLIGALLSTCPGIYHPGEYFGFYAAHEILPRTLANIPSSIRDRYLADVRRHAHEFARQTADEAGAAFFCDATPWNIMIASKLASAFPDCVFVLCVRRPEGVVDSLRRSYDAGFHWAGDSHVSRAKVYADFYERSAELPHNRTIVFDYDLCCVQPEAVLDSFMHRAAAILDVQPLCFDASVTATPYAAGLGSHSPLATIDADGRLVFHPRSSYDASAFSPSEHRELLDEARRALRVLRATFPHTVASSLAF